MAKWKRLFNWYLFIWPGYNEKIFRLFSNRLQKITWNVREMNWNLIKNGVFYWHKFKEKIINGRVCNKLIKNRYTFYYIFTYDLSIFLLIIEKYVLLWIFCWKNMCWLLTLNLKNIIIMLPKEKAKLEKSDDAKL